MDWYHYCKVCGDWYNPHYRIGVCETCNPDLAKDLPPRIELSAVARGPVNLAVDSPDHPEPEQAAVVSALEPEQPENTFEPEPLDPTPQSAPVSPPVERTSGDDDSDLYLTATQEFAGADRDEALWAKSLTLSGGDPDTAKYQYIQLRVDQLSGSSKATPSGSEAAGSVVKVNKNPPAGSPLSGDSDRELIQAIRDGRLRGQKHEGVWYLQEEAHSQSAKPSPMSQSGSAEPPMDRIRGFFGKLSRGDYGLARTYWLYYFLFVSLISWPLNLATGGWSPDPIAAMKGSLIANLIILPYVAVVLLGVWRAATRYEGRRLWAVLAKIVCGFAVLGILLPLLFVSYLYLNVMGKPQFGVINDSNIEEFVAAYADVAGNGSLVGADLDLTVVHTGVGIWFMHGGSRMPNLSLDFPEPYKYVLVACGGPVDRSAYSGRLTNGSPVRFSTTQREDDPAFKLMVDECETHAP